MKRRGDPEDEDSKRQRQGQDSKTEEAGDSSNDSSNGNTGDEPRNVRDDVGVNIEAAFARAVGEMEILGIFVYPGHVNCYGRGGRTLQDPGHRFVRAVLHSIFDFFERLTSNEQRRELVNRLYLRFIEQFVFREEKDGVMRQMSEKDVKGKRIRQFFSDLRKNNKNNNKSKKPDQPPLEEMVMNDPCHAIITGLPDIAVEQGPPENDDDEFQQGLLLAADALAEHQNNADQGNSDNPNFMIGQPDSSARHNSLDSSENPLGSGEYSEGLGVARLPAGTSLEDATDFVSVDADPSDDPLKFVLSGFLAADAPAEHQNNVDHGNSDNPNFMIGQLDSSARHNSLDSPENPLGSVEYFGWLGVTGLPAETSSDDPTDFVSVDTGSGDDLSEFVLQSLPQDDGEEEEEERHREGVD